MSVITGPWPRRDQADAELLRIGAELDKIERDHRALLEAEARRTAAQEAACRAVPLA